MSSSLRPGPLLGRSSGQCLTSFSSVFSLVAVARAVQILLQLSISGTFRAVMNGRGKGWNRANVSQESNGRERPDTERGTKQTGAHLVRAKVRASSLPGRYEWTVSSSTRERVKRGKRSVRVPGENTNYVFHDIFTLTVERSVTERARERLKIGFE